MQASESKGIRSEIVGITLREGGGRSFLAGFWDPIFGGSRNKGWEGMIGFAAFDESRRFRSLGSPGDLVLRRYLGLGV